MVKNEMVEMKEGREMDAAAAEMIMRWHSSGNGFYWDGQRSRYLANVKESRELLGITDHPGFWSPSTKIEHAFEMESALQQRRDVSVQLYVVELTKILHTNTLHSDPLMCYGDLWVLIHASPLDR